MTYDGEWEPSLLEHGGWATCQQVFDLISGSDSGSGHDLGFVDFTVRATAEEVQAVYLAIGAMLPAVAK